MAAFSKISKKSLSVVGSSYYHRLLSKELMNLMFLPCGSKTFHRTGENKVGETVFPFHCVEQSPGHLDPQALAHTWEKTTSHFIPNISCHGFLLLTKQYQEVTEAIDVEAGGIENNFNRCRICFLFSFAERKRKMTNLIILMMIIIMTTKQWKLLSCAMFWAVHIIPLVSEKMILTDPLKWNKSQG